MNQKTVVIMGSPHIKGNTSDAVQSLVDGIEKAGSPYTRYNLSKLNIKNCIGCRKCVDNGGMCVLQDDMREILDDIKMADTVIISSPIYICQVSGLVKTCLDRMLPLTDKHHKPRYGKKKLIMLYTYGAPVPLIFNKYIKYTGKSLKAMGLLIHKNIVIHGCTTIDKVKNDTTLKHKLFAYGSKLTKKRERKYNG